MDLSENGLSLSLQADLPFELGDRIDLSTEKYRLQAEIVWWSKLYNEPRIGPRTVESLMPFLHGFPS